MMRRASVLIDLYILRAIMPYVLMALFTLTVVLFAQQSNRFAEIILLAGLPASIVGEVALNLIPPVLLFAAPTAVLTGLLIGFSRLGGDSETVAMRAAGVSTWNFLRAPVAIGLCASAMMLYVSFDAAPQAAAGLRRVGLRIALYKLDSPVEPRLFNTDFPGKTIYVKEGDRVKGQWDKVFIYSLEKGGERSFLTARSGRVDSAAEQSELVLSDAVRTTVTDSQDGHNASSVVTEKLAQVRIRLPTNRATLIRRMTQEERDLDELSWADLRERAREGPAEVRREASITFHRRLALSGAPVLFALLGTALGLRIRRGGRGYGMVISIIALVIYYLLSLATQQAARVGLTPIGLFIWAPNLIFLCGSFILLRGGEPRRHLLTALFWRGRGKDQLRNNNWLTITYSKASRGGFLSLLDRSLLTALLLNFALAFTAFIILFLVFTLFELWKFIAATGADAWLVIRYLLFLLPLTSVSLAPIGTLVAVLATYALLARRNEALAWWGSGQSVYRLAFPGIFFALAVGALLWLVQEKIMPEANLRQDALRAQIRNGISRTSALTGRQWLASADGRRLYSFEYNEKEGILREPEVYEFDEQGIHLARVYRAGMARWKGAADISLSQGTTLELSDGQVRNSAETILSKAEPERVFKPTLNKPSQLSRKALSAYINMLKERGAATPDLYVALARKQSDPSSPLVMGLIGIPLALAFGRRSAIAALASALVIGLSFWGVAGGFQQLAVYGLLPPQAAAWGPPLIFATIGLYLLTRART